jgi:fatty acid desaturase
LLCDWAVIVASIAVAIRWWNVPVAAVAVAVIATRQHAILILYHDGVHGLIARTRRLNDFVVNAAIGVPLLLPLHLYRALHLSHHLNLGTDADPERVLLYHGQPWEFRPLPTWALLRQLAGDLFAWNAIGMTIRYFQESRRGGMLNLPRTSWYPELVVQFAAFYGAVAVSFFLWPTATLRAALLWFLPYFTITHLLQKIRSFAEHTTSDIDPSLSCSWSPGFLGRLTVWPYHINYHREHHVRPEIPWSRLPVEFPDARQRPGGDLLPHLWGGAMP